MRGMLMSLEELMKEEIFTNARIVKYIDKDHLPLETEKPIKLAPVLFREEQEDGTLLIMLWVENKLPNDWKRIKGATTAPKGFMWISNGKSLFNQDYRRALLRL